MCVRRLSVILAVAVLSASAGCSPPLRPEGPNVAVLRRMLEDMGEGRLELLQQLCTPQYRYHDAGAERPRTCADQARAVRTFRRAFSESDLTVEDIFGSGEKVAFRLTYRGTHTGTFLGIPPTGSTVRFRGLGIARMVNGKLLELWLDLDWATLFDQLGTTPPEWHGRWANRLFRPLPPLGDPPGSH